MTLPLSVAGSEMGYLEHITLRRVAITCGGKAADISKHTACQNVVWHQQVSTKQD